MEAETDESDEVGGKWGRAAARSNPMESGNVLRRQDANVGVDINVVCKEGGKGC